MFRTFQVPEQMFDLQSMKELFSRNVPLISGSQLWFFIFFLFLKQNTHFIENYRITWWACRLVTFRELLKSELTMDWIKIWKKIYVDIAKYLYFAISHFESDLQIMWLGNWDRSWCIIHKRGKNKVR